MRDHSRHSFAYIVQAMKIQFTHKKRLLLQIKVRLYYMKQSCDFIAYVQNNPTVKNTKNSRLITWLCKTPTMNQKKKKMTLILLNASTFTTLCMFWH